MTFKDRMREAFKAPAQTKAEVVSAQPTTRASPAMWPRLGTRMYAAARVNRLSGGYASNSSADQELVTSLTAVRSRSRALVRDSSYAKRAKTLVQNNTIGTGVGMQARVKSTRNDLNKRVNDEIESRFEGWACGEYCHVGRTLHLHDIERVLLGEVFEAGEIIVRKHWRAMPGSPVPFALEIIEPERIADDVQPSPTAEGNMVRMGIEVDRYYAPVTYWIREAYQGEFRLGVRRADRYEPVPASEIWHLRIADRWPQTRGIPWLHTAVSRLMDMDGYSESEIIAARAAAAYMGFIKIAGDPRSPLGGATQEDGSYQMDFEPGMMKKLAPGEDMVFHDPNRPNTAFDAFMRAMLREVAAGIGVSYASLSMDYSQSNYSASRLALLDDRDLWKYIQLWFCRSFRALLHRDWLQAAVLSGSLPVSVEAYANDLLRYEAVRFKPRGWSWIDPTSEVEAYIKAVRAGFIDVGHVIAQTADGRDLEDVLEAREQELEDMSERGLEFDTDPKRKVDGSLVKEPEPKKIAAPAAPQQPAAPEEAPAEENAGRHARLIPIREVK